MNRWVASPRKPGWPEPTRAEHELRQQHLQAKDRYIEELLAFRLAAVAPCSWGISELAIDQAAFSRRILRITRLVGRFASGAFAFVTDRQPLTTSIPLSTGSTALALHLALAPKANDGPSVAEAQDSGRALRLRRVGQREGATFLVPELQLQWDDDGADRYERLALARITLHAGRIELDANFLPPMIRVLADSFLPRAVEAVRGALEARQGELLGARRARPFSINDFRATQAPSFLLLSAVNQALAVLSGPLGDSLRPRELHATLAELLGALEALDGVPTERRAVPGYLHGGAGPVFRTILDRLLAVIPRVARAPHRSIPLRRVDAATPTFVASLDGADAEGKRVFLVASGIDEAALQIHLTAYARIASGAMLPSISQSAVRGVAAAAEFDPPPSIPSSATHVCFRLDTRSPYWTDILAQGDIAVQVQGVPPHFALVLYVLMTEPRR